MNSEAKRHVSVLASPRLRVLFYAIDRVSISPAKPFERSHCRQQSLGQRVSQSCGLDGWICIEQP